MFIYVLIETETDKVVFESLLKEAVEAEWIKREPDIGGLTEFGRYYIRQLPYAKPTDTKGV